jgi:hypothetical protein
MMSTANSNTRHIDGMIAQTTNPAEVARLTDLRDRGAEFSKQENRHGEARGGWWLDGVYLGKTTRDAMQAING